MNKWRHSRKDKGKDTSSNSEKFSAPEPMNIDISDSGELSFPVLKVANKSNLPYYSRVLSKKSDKPIGRLTLNGLQFELESMLSNVVDRKRNIQSELHNSSSNDDFRLKRKNNSSADTSADVLMKDVLFPATELEAPTIPDNEMPDKFHAFVDKHCGEITPESIKILQEMMAHCDIDVQGVKVPPLGEHYTDRWAKEDLDEENDPNSIDKSKKRLGELSPDSKRTKDRMAGPLVQRLVSALLEDNYCNSLQENQISNKFDDEYFSNLPMFHTTVNFERKLRKTLEAIGLLEQNTEESDQILDDLKKCDEELKRVAKRNKEYLSKVIVQAEQELKRQSIRSKIKTINVELQEISKKLNLAKSKKKQLPLSEKEEAWRALKQRDDLYNLLEKI